MRRTGKEKVDTRKVRTKLSGRYDEDRKFKTWLYDYKGLNFKDDKTKMDIVKQYMISIVGKQYPQL